MLVNGLAFPGDAIKLHATSLGSGHNFFITEVGAEEKVVE